MAEDLYEVWVGTSMIATAMNLDVTMILVEALIKKWYSEPALTIAVRKVKDGENNAE